MCDERLCMQPLCGEFLFWSDGKNEIIFSVSSLVISLYSFFSFAFYISTNRKSNSKVHKERQAVILNMSEKYKATKTAFRSRKTRQGKAYGRL
jgi:hypothetical protein